MASNNGGAEGFPFAAQKRSLEEAGWQSAQTDILFYLFFGGLLFFWSCYNCYRLTISFYLDEPDAKKVASQNERDSSLCTLTMHIDLTAGSAHFPATQIFLLLLQPLEPN